jgi:CheY-like chemotaxis protein
LKGARADGADLYAFCALIARRADYNSARVRALRTLVTHHRTTWDIHDVSSSDTLRAICIARHRFLSGHYCLVFADFGIDGTPVVGFERGIAAARAQLPDLVFCDYDLLAPALLRTWRRDPKLSSIPIIAVSLTRRPDEVNLSAREGVTSFLYLPLLTRPSASVTLNAAIPSRVRPPADVLRWDPDRLEIRTPP